MQSIVLQRALMGCAMVAISVTGIGCPPEDESQESEPIHAETQVYDFYDFWPFAHGNYWYWDDAEYPDNYLSLEVLKRWDLAGYDIWVVESIHGNYGGPPFASLHYWLLHPEGLYTTSSVNTFLEWVDNPDNLDLLSRWSAREYEEGTHPNFDNEASGLEYTVDTIANLAPFERCDEDDPSVLASGADDLIVSADTTCILVHSPDVCDDGTPIRRNANLFGLGIGPIIRNGYWNLKYALIDGVEYVRE